jgi:hypothetical protein
MEHAFPGVGLRTVHSVFQFAARRHIEFKGPVQFDIDGVQPPRNAPEFRNLT